MTLVVRQLSDASLPQRVRHRLCKIHSSSAEKRADEADIGLRLVAGARIKNLRGDGSRDRVRQLRRAFFSFELRSSWLSVSAVLMSCWVLPTIAAELWGVPLEQVLSAIHVGAVASKLDCGLTVIDLAPDNQALALPPPMATMPPPMTSAPAGKFEEAEESTLALVEPKQLDATAVEPALPEPSVPQAACASGAVEPIAAADDQPDSPWQVRRIQAVRPPRTTQIVHGLSNEVVNDESEDGPDPHFGEPEDGEPLNWRAGRTRAAAMRRRPPTRFN